MGKISSIDSEMENVAVRAATIYCKMNFPNESNVDVECIKIDFEAGFVTAVTRLEERAAQILRALEVIEKTASSNGELKSQASIRFLMEKIRGLK